ncbi:MAG: isoaspartyl peptidase/L-asparaginase [Ignavibacteriae bacterium]|nr:isoaspartyl peptidase/L-asparaginase [Ignavibacteriota bacterium]NOG99045.1 isoaspartyl peptidase/L-asparaginase [Ignavibacteriota bacterium]
MKKLLYPVLAAALFIIFSCSNKENRTQYGLVIHGGSGNIYKGKYTSEEENAYKVKLMEALTLGDSILNSGGSSLECVEKVINLLEDSPLFNAGKGAVLTNVGTCELDASIMDGRTLNAGAVAGVQRIKNPISLAKTVMTNSRHLLLTGDGAEKFALENEFNLIDNEYFRTKKRYDQWQNSIEKKLKQKEHRTEKDEKLGTVGCAALDLNGNLAAGTSTGGISSKRFGRVGDSPIIGAGTYANNKTCAVSATGTGEYFIRNVAAYDISAKMEYQGKSLNEAAEEVIISKLTELGGSGGIIAIDNKANIVTKFNTKGMFRGSVKNGEMPIVKLYIDE